MRSVFRGFHMGVTLARYTGHPHAANAITVIAYRDDSLRNPAKTRAADSQNNVINNVIVPDQYDVYMLPARKSFQLLMSVYTCFLLLQVTFLCFSCILLIFAFWIKIS